jgi:hypothetical protein
MKTIQLQDPLYFDRKDDKLYKNTFGLWKIEGLNTKRGGRIQWVNVVRFKNLRYKHTNTKGTRNTYPFATRNPI